MGRALRSEQFLSDEISICHCVQRCVRRAWLAGVDPVSGNDYSYRREWIRRRMEALASVFAIDVLTYAILSNHIHIVLRNRPDVAATWSDEQIAIRWLRVFPGRRIEEHLAEPSDNDVQMLIQDKERFAKVKERLSDISWFMRALSEPIARMANRQDEVTGRFWEGRFKAQPITDEAGLLACAMYVDLNPIRAAMAETVEESQHTSAFDRIQGANGQMVDSAAFDLVPANQEEQAEKTRNTPLEDLRKQRTQKRRNPTGKRIRTDDWLAPLSLGTSDASDPESSTSGVRASDKGFLPIKLSDYLRLLRWTAKQGGSLERNREVPPSMRETLTLLGIDLSMWSDLVWNFKRYFDKSACVGSPTSMSDFAKQSGRNWVSGQRGVAPCFSA